MTHQFSDTKKEILIVIRENPRLGIEEINDVLIGRGTAFIDNSTVRYHVNNLVKEKEIIRAGEGVKNSPYNYFINNRRIA